jgi:hypothetical protein
MLWLFMVSDKNLAKRLRRIYRDVGDVARVDAANERVRAEFATLGHVPRYKPATGRNARLRNQMIEHGLSLNTKDLTDGARERLTAKKFGRSQRIAHRVFKSSSDKE